MSNVSSVPLILNALGEKLTLSEANSIRAMANLDTIVTQLSDAAAAILASAGTISVDIDLSAAPPLDRPEKPSEFKPTPPEYGDRPELDAIPNPEPLVISGGPPANFGTAPGAMTPFTGHRPANNVDFHIPTIGGMPTLAPRTRGNLADITIRAFDAARPEYVKTFFAAPSLPGSIERYEEAPTAATTALLQSHIDMLKTRIETGGTGLPPAIESAIWSRARDREMTAARAAEADVIRQDAARGFYTPTGLAQAKLMAVRSDSVLKMNTLSRDIAIKQAELELSNVQKALELITPVEQVFVQYETSCRQRVLEAVRQANEAALQIYDALLKGYLAAEETRKIGVSLYQAEIQAYEAKARAYASEIGAEQAKADVNKAIVEQYVAELGANNALLEAYKAEVDATVAVGKMEELKLKAFEADVSAFSAEAQAYLAQTQAKGAEMQIFSERVKAYQAEVQGYAAETEAKTKAKSAEIEAYRARQDANRLRVEAYKAVVDAEGTRASAEAQAASAIAQSESIYASAVGSFNTVTASLWAAEAQAHIQAASTVANVSKMNADLLQTSRSMSMDASKVTAQVYSQLLSSIMSQTHYSLGASGSVSASDNQSANYNFDAIDKADMPNDPGAGAA